MKKKRYCSQCGTELRQNARYCSNCGTPKNPELNKLDPPFTPEMVQSSIIRSASNPQEPLAPPTPPRMGLGKYLRLLLTNPPLLYKHMAMAKENRNTGIIVLGNLTLAALAVMILYSKITFSGNFIDYFLDFGFSIEYLAEISDVLNLMVPGILIFGVYVTGILNLITASLIYWIFINLSGGDRNLIKTLRIVSSSSVAFWILGFYQLIAAFLSAPMILPISTVIEGDLTAFFAITPIINYVIISLAGLWQGVLIGYGLHYSAKISGRRAMVIGIGYWLFVTILESILSIYSVLLL